MLTDEEKAKLQEQEAFRRSLHDSLAPPPKGGLEAFLSPDTLKWLATTIAIPLVVWAYGYWETQQRQASLANERAIADSRKDVDQLTALVPGLSSADARQQSVALAVLATLVKVKSASPSIQQVYDAVSIQATAGQKSGDPAQASAATAAKEVLIRNSSTDALAPAAPTDQATSSAPQVQAAAAPPTTHTAITGQTFVYLQIYHPQQQPEAQALQAMLRDQGVPVLGIQNMLNNATAGQLKFAQRGPVDIRFYHPEDKAAAQSLVPIIKSVSPQYGEPTIHDLSMRQHLGKLGLLEIWYPCADKSGACAAS